MLVNLEKFGFHFFKFVIFFLLNHLCYASFGIFLLVSLKFFSISRKLCVLVEMNQNIKCWPWAVLMAVWMLP